MKAAHHINKVEQRFLCIYPTENKGMESSRRAVEILRTIATQRASFIELPRKITAQQDVDGH